MKRAVILHGLPSTKEYHNLEGDSQSNSHWLPWLQQQLCGRDILAQTPEMPTPFVPDYDAWADAFEHQVADKDTILVGHSMGGGFIVRYLSEHPEKEINKVILVAPWLNLSHEEDTTFFDFDLDQTIVGRIGKLIIFSSDNDHEDVNNSIRFLREKIPSAIVKTFHNYGHFCLRDMKTREFPELLEVCLN